LTASSHYPSSKQTHYIQESLRFKIVFVTSTIFIGLIGDSSVENADNFCQTLANDANLGGIYTALYSTDGTDALDRFERSPLLDSIPYVLSDGVTKFVDDWEHFNSNSRPPYVQYLMDENKRVVQFADFIGKLMCFQQDFSMPTPTPTSAPTTPMTPRPTSAPSQSPTTKPTWAGPGKSAFVLFYHVNLCVNTCSIRVSS